MHDFLDRCGPHTCAIYTSQHTQMRCLGGVCGSTIFLCERRECREDRREAQAAGREQRQESSEKRETRSSHCSSSIARIASSSHRGSSECSLCPHLHFLRHSRTFSSTFPDVTKKYQKPAVYDYFFFDITKRDKKRWPHFFFDITKKMESLFLRHHKKEGITFSSTSQKETTQTYLLFLRHHKKRRTDRPPRGNPQITFGYSLGKIFAELHTPTRYCIGMSWYV